MPRPKSLLIAVSPREAEAFLPPRLQAEIAACAHTVTWFDPTQQDKTTWTETLSTIKPEVIIGCWSTPQFPADLPAQTRYLCYLTGSIRHLVTREHLERGLIVTDWGNSISRYIAEAALLHTLSCLRRTPQITQLMHVDRCWPTPDAVTATLFDRRVGIHGFGRIARELVPLLAPFKCTIDVFAPDVDATTCNAFGITASASLEALFAHNQIVIELAPLNDATRGSVTESLLRLLAPGEVFVNVGRAGIVDEPALLKIAQEGEVLLGLDVFHFEPLPADSPLRSLPNVNLTPHNAGPTSDGRQAAGAHAVANLQAYTLDQPLRGVITPPIFDRST